MILKKNKPSSFPPRFQSNQNGALRFEISDVASRRDSCQTLKLDPLRHPLPKTPAWRGFLHPEDLGFPPKYSRRDCHLDDWKGGLRELVDRGGGRMKEEERRKNNAFGLDALAVPLFLWSWSERQLEETNGEICARRRQKTEQRTVVLSREGFDDLEVGSVNFSS